MIPIVLWRRDAGHTYHIGSHTVTPIAQSIGVRWRGGGWLWQFPLAVEFQNKERGEQGRLPIPDPTRALVWFLFALVLTVAMAAVLSARRKRQRARAESARTERKKG